MFGSLNDRVSEISPKRQLARLDVVCEYARLTCPPLDSLLKDEEVFTGDVYESVKNFYARQTGKTVHTLRVDIDMDDVVEWEYLDNFRIPPAAVFFLGGHRGKWAAYSTMYESMYLVWVD